MHIPLLSDPGQRPIVQINPKTDDLLAVFPSAQQAGLKLDLPCTNINQVCLGYRKKIQARRTAGGHKWMYLEDAEKIYDEEEIEVLKDNYNKIVKKQLRQLYESL